MVGSRDDGLISGGDNDDNKIEDGSNIRGNNDAIIGNNDVVGIIDCDIICGDADDGINDDGNDDAIIGNNDVVDIIDCDGNYDAIIGNNDVVGITDCDIICGDADDGSNDDDGSDDDSKLGNDNVVIRGAFGRSGCTNLLLQRPHHSSVE